VQWFSAQPIGRKLTILVMAVTTSALVLSAAGFLAWDTVRFRNETLGDLETQGALVARNTSVALVFDLPGDVGATLADLAARRNIDNAAVYDATGTRVAEFVRHQTARNIPDRAMGWAAQGNLRSAEILRPVTTDDGKIVGYVYLATELDDMWARFRAQLLALTTMFVLAGGAALLLSSRLQRVISRPLADLSQTASAISKRGDYSLRARPAHQDELGTVVTTFNTMLDRIEERELELKEANVVLQDANRLKDDFLATLSHELRTPLNAVVGWSRLLRGDRMPAEARARALDAIERNATVQARLIDDLLDISSVMRGKFRLQVEPLDLRTVVDAAVEIVRPGASAKNVAIDVHCEEGSGLVTGDAQRLQQVLWNLLSNSVKFTPAGGRIVVRLASEGSGELIEVSDTGQGIDPAFLPHVFDLFRQADASSTREYGGLGLGLAIVRKVVELHGGTVAAASDGPGLGTTMRVRLPRRSATVESPAAVPDVAVAPPPRTTEGLRILVVEDDADSRDMVEALLTERGARVTAVGSALEGMAAIEAAAPDIVLSDIAMQGHDGYALIQWIRELPGPLAAVPAVALTAYAGEADRRRVLAAGFQGFVSKPFDAEILVATLADLAERAPRA
jgi:signal transduction histidine kinase/ActR/RegA family two-component response regulator